MSDFDSREACPAELPNFCAQRHWAIFWVLIICSFVVVTGRVLTVRNWDASGESPFFSANDRSRWCTVRALGDDGNYEIDDVIKSGQPVRWDTIDRVMHVGNDGQMHSYSSKPTLFPTLVAGKYRALKWLAGWNFQDHTLKVTRVLLLLVNAIPWAIYLWFFARLINSVPVRDWARYYLLACAGFGTYLSTFAISLNNHLPAAVSVMIALYFLSQVWRKANQNWWAYAVIGLSAGFAAANELPALAFVACAGLLCLWRSPAKTVLGFAPGLAVVVAALIGTNFQAHGQWRLPYAHRSDGAIIKTFNAGETSPAWLDQLDQGIVPALLVDGLTESQQIEKPVVERGRWPGTPADVDRWVVKDKKSGRQLAIVRPVDGPTFEVRQWDNWYEYPGSYWTTDNDSNKSAVDQGQASRALYTFHILFGHHGIFPLTPIWLLALAGMIALACGAKMAGRFTMRWLGVIGLASTVVVITFYVMRPEMDRNYGGVTSCLRWLLWLTPIWLTSMLPVVDWLASSRKGQAFCLALFAVSALSAMYSVDNPWIHPWLYECWDLTGLPK